MDLSIFDQDELPENYFEEEIQQIVKQDMALAYISSDDLKSAADKNFVLPETSSMVYIDIATERMLVGAKKMEEPRYDVINDPRQAIAVFKWQREFDQGSRKRFPDLPLPKPIIPVSRYAKTNDLQVIDQYMVSRGFRILRPTNRQKLTYPHLCDEYEKCEIVVLTDSCAGDTQWVIQTLGATDAIKKGVETSVYLHSPLHRKEARRIMKELGIIEVQRSYKQQRQESPFRYYSRKYHPNDEISSNFIMSLDVNPFSPYTAQDIQEFIREDNVVKYRKIWKDKEVVGNYSMLTKRYYSNVWYRNVFSEHTPYNKSLMGLDFTTNSYRLAEKYIITKKNLPIQMEYPMMIDSFQVHSNRVRDHPHRGMLRYKKKDETLPLSLCEIQLPYVSWKMTAEEREALCVVPDLNGDEVEIHPVHHMEEEFIIEKVAKVHRVMPSQYHKFVQDMKVKHNMSRMTERHWKDAKNKMSKYFVWREKVENVSENEVSHIVQGYAYKMYKVFKSPMDSKKTLNNRKVFEKKRKKGNIRRLIPYSVMHYPTNPWGSLVPSFVHMRIEEFILQFNDMKTPMKTPPWYMGLESMSSAYRAEMFKDEDFIEFADARHAKLFSFSEDYGAGGAHAAMFAKVIAGKEDFT